MTLDHHILALIAIVGSSLDVLGAMYLAYDLLGGEHGPLRTLTRGVTYGALFGLGYGLGLGPVFGLLAGAAHGITLAWELSCASRGLLKPTFWFDTAMSAIRGAGFALGGAYLYGPAFGAVFGTLSMLGQVVAYRIGIRPTMDYRQSNRPHISRAHVLTTINRAAGYLVAGYVSSLAAHHGANALNVGLRTGLLVGLVSGVAMAFMPSIEWTADHLRARRMGVLGVVLILIGFALQSVQYWAALLDMKIV